MRWMRLSFMPTPYENMPSANLVVTLTETARSLYRQVRRVGQDPWVQLDRQFSSLTYFQPFGMQ